MFNIIRRSVAGEIFQVTSREDAVQEAVRNLNPNADDLIREIEADIKMQARHGQVGASVRGGKYTLEAVKQAASLYQDRDWVVRFDGYWLNLK